ncbi:acetyltransferase [Carex littledalei]|uniref:Acetyltransferase n=1 Tax=Carex littledalei TaxID=544730 RepID=A0A833RM12_9POAL|nr:acetyltransferase [Carex littledalei]
MASTNHHVIITDTYQIKYLAIPLAPRLIQFTPWELALLNAQYIQKGLLFAKPPHLSFEEIFELLKDSLEETLHHFYPFSGRLKVTCDGETTFVELELVPGSDGAEIIRAVAERVTVADVASYYDRDSPEVLKELFPLDGAVSFDGCCKPLLVVQVTDLSDGVFVGCALNVMVADGTSIWHFWNSWAEIARAKVAGIEYVLSRPVVHEKFFFDVFGDPPIKLPISSPTQFIERLVSPPIRERLFHFSPESIATLKARANQECAEGTISSFQALASVVWRSITRARHMPPDAQTTFQLAIQNRSRLQPPLSPYYFGSSIYVTKAVAGVSEILDHDLGWAALLVNRAIAAHDDSSIRNKVHEWMADPIILKLSSFNQNAVYIGSGPRFEMYECDFGWGKPVSTGSGTANKQDGKLSLYPGWEGRGSMDLEVCLFPDAMAELLKDNEFMSAVSEPVDLEVRLDACLIK